MQTLEGELERETASISIDEAYSEQIAAEVESRGRRRGRRRLAIALGVGLALTGTLITTIISDEFLPAQEVALLALVLGLIILLPLALVGGARSILGDGESALYKRLRPGRQLSGVCLAHLTLLAATDSGAAALRSFGSST